MQHNSARQGGGLWNHFSGTATLIASTLHANTAFLWGGGLRNRGGQVRLVRSTVSRNRADSHSGGGLYNTAGTLELLSSTVSSNTAVGVGGIVNAHGTLSLSASTVSGNTATFLVAGIFNNGGVVRFAKSIIAGNTLNGYGSDCVDGQALQSRGYNLTGMGTGCPRDPGRGDLTVDPARVFAEVLGPLQDNGGLTFTHALLPGSPALDVIDSDKCPGKDQRGVVRPQGSRCDIGAFELEVP